MTVENIEKEDLEAIKEVKKKSFDLAIKAERAVADFQKSELETKVIIQGVFLKNSLNLNCKIDENTGVVTWPEEKKEEIDDKSK